MSTSNFNLRNVAPNVMFLLKKEAAQQKISVNSLVLSMIEQGLGIAQQTRKNIFHDLDYLAGTWSDEDQEAFDNNVKSFEKIDQEFWL